MTPESAIRSPPRSGPPGPDAASRALGAIASLSHLDTSQGPNRNELRLGEGSRSGWGDVAVEVVGGRALRWWGATEPCGGR